MKGILFSLAEEVVRDRHGEDAWDAVLDGAGLDGSWTSLGDYPDEHLSRVVSSAAVLLGVDDRTALRTIAEGAMPLLAGRFPHFFTPHTDALEFVRTVNGIIHPEVLKLYPGATTPQFGFLESPERTLTMAYCSPRRLCALAEGFLRGAARHYGQTVDVTQPSCMLDGADQCVLHCEFSPVPRPPAETGHLVGTGAGFRADRFDDGR